MKYRSTRGGVQGLSFVDSLLMGLASDGGLLVPESIPDVRGNLAAWRQLDFVDLAQAVISEFVDDIPRPVLDELVTRAYAQFDHPDVVGEVHLDNLTLLELFHGPTLAFKDVALQLLGQLYNYVLQQRGEHLNILGATSGDTGSAAIAAVRGQANIDIYILYPDNKVSPLQELQMTTVADSNVHCIAVDGSFDDCQGLMKTIFGDLDFKAQHQLGSVNSVNWARVMAQIVYYGYASLRSPEPANFVVPTGNFGNVFAAYLAKQMGFPINKLAVATNENDILARFFATGEYARGDVHYTLSPAMDIQIASNFERYLFFYFGQDADRLAEFMQHFQQDGKACLDAAPEDGTFMATSVNNDETLAAIAEAHRCHGYTLDPHTAVAYTAAQKLADQLQGPTVIVATAHPAKFPEAVAQAVPGLVPRHNTLDNLAGMPQRKLKVAAEVAAVKGVISG